MHPRTQLEIIKSFLLIQGVPMPHVQSSCLENPRARFCEWLGKRTRVTVAKCTVGLFGTGSQFGRTYAKCQVLNLSRCARLFLKKLSRSHYDSLKNVPRCARKIIVLNPQNMCKVFTISESQNLRIPSHHALVHKTAGCGEHCCWLAWLPRSAKWDASLATLVQ